MNPTDTPASFVDQRDLVAVDRFLDRLEGPLTAWFRPVVRGLDRIPMGRALVVANHNGGVLMPDVWTLACAWRKARGSADLPYGLGHDAALETPHLGAYLRSLGAVAASQGVADALFAAGKKVLVFPGGDVENMRPFSQRDRIVFGPRRGYVRLAIKNGVPISPIVTSGAHSGMMVLDDGQKLARALGFTKLRIHVCPTVVSIPWGITIGFPPPYLPVPIQTYLEALAPLTFARSGPEAADDEGYVEQCHAEVVRRMQAALERLSTERRTARRGKIDGVLDGLLDRALNALAPRHDPPAKPEPESPSTTDRDPVRSPDERARHLRVAA